MSIITVKRNLLFGAVLVGAATTAWFLTGCRDYRTNVTSPSVRSSLLSPPAGPLFVCAADSVAATDSATIGLLGGTINFGPHSLLIPPGALLRRTTITATAPADGHLTAVLQPEGLRFLVPATLTLGYGQCNPPPSNTLSIVYLKGPLGQILQWLPSLLHLDSHAVSALIGHFSVYAGAERR
jgi:hypothetical protein